MKRFSAALIAASLASLSAASFASSAALIDAFGPRGETLLAQDADSHAAQLFDQVDRDGDNHLSVDEYASQAVVLASLSRFNGKVAIEDRQGETFHIALPEQARAQMSGMEQTAIDAIARNEFYKISGGDGQLSRAEWLAARGRAFAQADFDHDGRLQRQELALFAMDIARYRPGAS